jgi:hypothetical protein
MVPFGYGNDDILTLQYNEFAVDDGGIISFAIDIPNNHTRLISFHLDQNDILHQVSSLQNNSREQ